MLVSKLDFDLPPRLIAQEPARPRDAARLLHARCAALALGEHRIEHRIEHRQVRDLPLLLQRGDLLVVNDSRVLRARLRGVKAGTGGRVEALLLREAEANVWECMLRPSARLKPGAMLHFHAPGAPHLAPLQAHAAERAGENWMLRFVEPGAEREFDVRQVLGAYGEVPLPPYIHGSASDVDYQTVYARQDARAGASSGESGAGEGGAGEGGALDSCAAPTAGLHFTPGLLDALRERGVEMVSVTLGVGPGTFRPVQTETLEEHPMHAEEFLISASAAARINAQKERGGRVVAVGTTSARALESSAGEGVVRSGLASTQLFVRPPFGFQVVDALMTNFHLPRSTLLALVAAWVQHRARRDGVMLDGLAITHALYAHAIEQSYRFFSFGDAMLLD